MQVDHRRHDKHHKN